MPRAERRLAAILVFDGVQIIDFSAPFEVLGQAGFTVFTVGPTRRPVTTAMSLAVSPTYDFASAPPSQVLVLPGGDLKLADARIIAWVRQRVAAVEVALSVCNGAFWLAAAGLLDGLAATTFHLEIDKLQAAAPRTRVVRGERFVDNGKIVTAAGLSAGIEGALHVVRKLKGEEKARQVAEHIEYDWRPAAPAPV